MDVRYLILSLFFLVSCMPTAQVSKGNLASTDTTSGSTSGSTTGIPTSPLKWNYLGDKVDLITINVSNYNNAYLIGSSIETYLSDSANFTNATYCFVSSYKVAGVSFELRSRVVPISYVDFTTRRTVRNLRVDFPDSTSAGSACNKPLRVQDDDGQYITDSTSPSYVYDPAAICSNCTAMLVSNKVRLFKVNGLTLDEVPPSIVKIPNLSMQVDPNFAVGGSSGTCSNTDCRARGFDCCLENQCVTDGATKPNASTLYSSLLQSVEAERLQNPLAYLNYPQLYYICGSNVPTTGGSSSGSSTGSSSSGSTGGSYDEGFAQLKKDYYCIQNLKTQSTVTPFHNEVLSRTYTASTDCLTSSSQSSDTQYYQNVMKRLYTTCGCNRTELVDMIANCPAYDYTVTTADTAGTPVRIDCYTPPVDSGSVPLQQSVSVSSKSAPHRFFDTSGVEKDITSGATQEGDTFEYLDEGKVLPIQSSFGMNSILGQMNVTLDKALPAKSVKVELDQVYFIQTTSGYFTPCPTCAKDSWLNTFTAFPVTGFGTGLQAIGHTTERDAFSTNTTSGNYEDTIFGRACWLPPTMIPYSHTPKGTVQSQRLNRLTTQAGLFVNGYQRDWFGFNKGAMIGSFDGVTWFAIGKGRIVRSSSKKLFLAINAPFADVAANTMHVVKVYAYDGVTQAAQVDYDPQYHQSHPYQNEAGNCQKYHMCSTDTDCVTKLGWEYACADVKDLKTNWPEFDADGNEKANTSDSVTLDQILQQKRYPSSSTKRCVYRGAGSICHSNSGSLAATDLNKKKLLTCAPNFFCGNAGSSVHNSKIARYAADLESIPVSRNHFYGKDTNILGRPLNYTGNESLSSSIAQTLRDNLSPFEASMNSNTGICQPGKSLPTAANSSTMSNPFNQHMLPDANRRTDFISQIGSCNPTLFSTMRHTSCPVIASDGNYEIFSAGTIATGYEGRATAQNACGLESLMSTASLSSTADSLLTSSPFRTIEAKPLNSQIITDPTLARDACFRRAGSVCHTDLDCSPNKLHATQVDFFANSYFGNLAEKSYWSEYLVCGQADPKPLPSAGDVFKNYDMSKNRCCREIGKDLTTYTSDIPTDTFVNAAKPYEAISAGLKMSVSPGFAPNDPKRYSRLATVEGIGGTKPILSGNIDRNGTGLDNSKTNISTPGQWKTLTEANSESCCGGGWIRKFSDGTNDWTRRDRVALDVTKFACINSRSIMITHPEQALTFASAATAINNVNQDYGDYCKDSTNLNGACAQYSIIDSTNDVYPEYSNPQSPFNSYGYPAQVIINTIKPDYGILTNGDFYFMPRSADGNASVIIDFNDANATARRNIALKMPSYADKGLEDQYTTGSLQVSLIRDDGTAIACGKNAGINPAAPITPPPGTCTGLFNCADEMVCYYAFDASTRVLKITPNQDLYGDSSISPFYKKKVGARVVVNLAKATANLAGFNRSKPGTSAYYLKRFGKLELSGIPQIMYEEMYCNDNPSRLIEGIFDSAVKTDTNFKNVNYSFSTNYTTKNSAGNSVFKTPYSTNVQGLQLEPVFSSNDYKCCSPLGKTVTDSAKCCSGFGVAISANSNQKTCALPAGTDLMVYFNRFVSNEGQGTDAPGGGLLETDFDSQSGEPVLTAAVNDKIRELGSSFCASGKVRQGGAFGLFEVEPQGSQTNTSSKIYNIVDSSHDVGQNSNAGSTDVTGYPAFADGFRWNHHLYCAD
jgi:hypothetical protein